MRYSKVISSLWKLIVAGVIVAGSTAVWAEPAFTVSSPDLQNGIQSEQVYAGYGCTGGNVSPELNWTGAPANTKSFAVTVYDPAAPTGSGWWHWQIYNIPADTTHLAKNAGDPEAGLAPAGSVQAINDFGTRGYGGPCPPKGSGPHPFAFTVYALDTATIKLPKDASGALVGFMLHAHTIDTATLTVKFGR